MPRFEAPAVQRQEMELDDPRGKLMPQAQANGKKRQWLGGGAEEAGTRKVWPFATTSCRSASTPIRSAGGTDRRSGRLCDPFSSTGIRTDEHGQATVEFGLNDAVTSFRVFGDAFSAAGASATNRWRSNGSAPFYLEPKLPLEVTTGDVIRVPLGIVNATNSPLENGSLEYQVKTSSKVEAGDARFTLPANGRVRQYVNLQVGRQIGEAQVSLDAAAGPYRDKVARSLMVRPARLPGSDRLRRSAGAGRNGLA